MHKWRQMHQVSGTDHARVYILLSDGALSRAHNGPHNAVVPGALLRVPLRSVPSIRTDWNGTQGARRPLADGLIDSAHTGHRYSPPAGSMRARSWARPPRHTLRMVWRKLQVRGSSRGPHAPQGIGFRTLLWGGLGDAASCLSGVLQYSEDRAECLPDPAGTCHDHRQQGKNNAADPVLWCRYCRWGNSVMKEGLFIVRPLIQLSMRLTG